MFDRLAMSGPNNFPGGLGGQPNRQPRAGRGPSYLDDFQPPDEGEFPIAAPKLSTFGSPNQAQPSEAQAVGKIPTEENISSTAQHFPHDSFGNTSMVQNMASEGSQGAHTGHSNTPILRGNEALLQMLGSPLGLQGVLTGGPTLQLPGMMGTGPHNFHSGQFQLSAQAGLCQPGSSLPPHGSAFLPMLQSNQKQEETDLFGNTRNEQNSAFIQASFTPKNVGKSVEDDGNRHTAGQSGSRSTDSKKSPAIAPPAAKKRKLSSTSNSEAPAGKQSLGKDSSGSKSSTSRRGVDLASGRVADRRYNNPSSSMSLVASARAEDKSDQKLTGIRPTLMYLSCDDESLSDYQCFLRQQIELFEATNEDLQLNAQKMNKSVVLGQVGIRCRHCARQPPWTRARGAVYYSATLDGLYQAGQNMSKNHLSNHCTSIPDRLKQELINLKDGKRRAGGGKQYWSEAARALGVYEDQYGLRFRVPSARKGGNKS